MSSVIFFTVNSLLLFMQATKYMHLVVIFDFHIPHIGLCLTIAATCYTGFFRSDPSSLFAFLIFLSLDPSFLSPLLLVSISSLISLLHALLLIVRKAGHGICMLFAISFWWDSLLFRATQSMHASWNAILHNSVLIIYLYT